LTFWSPVIVDVRARKLSGWLAFLRLVVADRVVVRRTVRRSPSPRSTVIAVLGDVDGDDS
jgi:hypothetical protein